MTPFFSSCSRPSDGTKSFPINHGKSSSETFLKVSNFFCCEGGKDVICFTVGRGQSVPVVYGTRPGRDAIHYHGAGESLKGRTMIVKTHTSLHC